MPTGCSWPTPGVPAGTSTSIFSDRRFTTYSVEKLGFPLRAFVRLPDIKTDNWWQGFAEANREDARKAIAIVR